jgi:hypothetical protein
LIVVGVPPFEQHRAIAKENTPGPDKIFFLLSPLSECTCPVNGYIAASIDSIEHMKVL